MFECRIKENEFPEDGEIVVGKTQSTDGDILNMKLIEYGDIPGLVLSNEVSKKRIRSMHQITKLGSTEVCQVLKIDKAKGYIDLSLKSVGDKEKKECLEKLSKNKLAYQIMLKAAKAAKIPVKDLYEKIGYEKAREHSSLYNYFAKGKNEPSLMNDSEYGKFFIQVIEEQFKPTSFKVRADMDVTSCFGGVNAIKDAFRKAMEQDPSLEITLLKTPTYSIVKTCNDKDSSFEAINQACSLIKELIEADGGTFVVSSPPKVYGEKNKHGLLDESLVDDNAEDSSTSSDDVDKDSD